MDTPVPASANATETFTSVVDSFPYAPTTDEGRGFLPILSRASGHILYLVARYSEKSKPTNVKALEELNEAKAHWDYLVIDNSLSEKAKGEIGIITNALNLAISEISSWESKDAELNLSKLANRITQLMANLDREVLGLRESDAGLTL